MFDLKEALKEKIAGNNKADEDYKEHQTDLIITKIIMAAMGCVPAYDRYFKNGINKELKKNNSRSKLNNFNKDSFNNLLNFIRKNKDLKKVCKASWHIRGTNIKYPPMKLLDLYFWLRGSQTKTQK